MKRTLSLVLCFCLIFSMFGTALVGTAGAAVTQYNDLATTHWGYDEIMYMSSKSILQGNLGNFRADDTMTKAEFIKVINYTFGLNQTSYKSFADVSTSKWYYNDIMKAASHGYLTTNGNYVYPDSQLTREEACALVARYLGIEATYNYNRFTDSAQISYAYQAYVNACAENGIVNGYTNGEFRPKNVLTRAEASAIIYRLAGSIYTTSAYGTDAGANYTNAVINTNGVTVTSANLSGTVYVSEGTENGTVTLSNCTVNGTLKVTGAATVNLINSTVAKLVVDTTSGKAATINVSGTSVINAAEVKSSAKIVNGSTYADSAVRAITMAADPYATLTLDGEFQAVTVNNPYNYIALNDADTVIKKLTVAQGATNNKVTGNGKIEDTVIAAAGANYSVVPVKYAISNGITAIFAGNQYTGTGAASTYPKYYFVDGALEIRELRNTSGTMYYVIVPNNAAAPTAQQVINGVDYGNVTLVDAGSINLSAGYENVDTSINLASSTNYDLYTYFKANNASVTGAPEKIDLYTATTPAFAANYPTYGTLAYVSANNYTMPIKVKANASCTAYAIAVAKGSTAPSASQIYETAKGSTSYNANVAIASRAVVSVSANTETTISLTGLANSSYDYYVVLANASAAPVAIRSTNTVVTSVDTGFVKGYPVVTNVANNYVTVALKTSTAGTAYVLPYNSAAYVPTASQIMSSGTAVAMSTLSADGYYYNSATVYMYGSDKVAVVFVPSYSAAKAPVFGNIYPDTVLYPAVQQATSTGFRAGYPQITWLSVANNQLTLTARTNEVGRVYIKGYSNVVPTAEAIYTYNVSFPVSYDASLGCYVGSKTVGYANPNIAALFVPANGTYATYLPVYGAIGTVQGEILRPNNAPSTSVPTVTIPKAVDSTTKELNIAYNERMFVNGIALSEEKDQADLKALFPITVSDGSTVDYTVTVSDNPSSTSRNTAVIIKPATSWKEGVTYTVTPNSGIRNAAGNAPVTKSGTFKVNVTRPSAVLAPTTGVQTSDAVLTLTFTQAMALKTVDNATADLTNANIGSYVTVYKNGDSSNPVNATATISEDKKVVTISVADKLAANTKYDVKLSASVVNAAGTAPAATTYSFTTVAQTAVATPVIVVKSGDELVNADTLKAGTYTVAITYDNTTSKVYYTLDGKTPVDGSNEYTGEIEITIAPKQEIKIKAIAKANTGTDLASSTEVTRVLTGEEVTISANPVSGSAVTAGTDVALTTSYGEYTIKFLKSAEKVTENLEANAVAGTPYTSAVEDLAGKYLYAVAVDANNKALGPVAEFYYPAFVSGNLISIDTDLTDGYAETADVISIGYPADADIDYNYELIATILINGKPLTYEGEYVKDYNFGKKIVQFSVKDTVNAKIDIDAKIVAVGSNEVVTDSDKFFANPAIVINLTTGTGDAAVTTNIANAEAAKVNYGTDTVFEIVAPTTEFAWDWTSRVINDQPYASDAIAKISADLANDIAATAKATVGGKELTATAAVEVQPVAPVVLDADGKELASGSTISYIAGTPVNVKFLDGLDNTYRFDHYTDANEWNVLNADNKTIVACSNWGYIPANQAVVTLKAEINGRTAESTYTFTNGGESTSMPVITVTTADGKKLNGEVVVVNVGDTISATTSVVGGTIAIYKGEDTTTNYATNGSYKFTEADAGQKIKFTANVTNNDGSAAYQWVIVKPVAPEIKINTAGTRAYVVVPKNSGVISGFDYSVVDSTGTATSKAVEVAKQDDAEAYAYEYAIGGDYKDGYTVTAKAYATVDGVKYYSDEVTAKKLATPTIKDYELKSGAYYVVADTDLEFVGNETIYATINGKESATTSAKITEAATITLQAKAAEGSDVLDSNVSGEYTFRILSNPTFSPESGAFVKAGGDEVEATFTDVQYAIGEVKYYAFVDGKEANIDVVNNKATIAIPAAAEDAETVVVTVGMTVGNAKVESTATYNYVGAPYIKGYKTTAENGDYYVVTADVKPVIVAEDIDQVEIDNGGYCEEAKSEEITLKAGANKIKVRNISTGEESGLYKFFVVGDIEPTFDLADGTLVATSGGDKVTVTFPELGINDEYVYGEIARTVTANGEEIDGTVYTIPAGKAGDSVELVASITITADGETYTTIENSATYTYAAAPEFKAYNAEDGKEIPVAADENGTYVVIKEGTEIYLEITNAEGKTAYWKVNGVATNKDTKYEADKDTISNISDKVNEGVSSEIVTYVTAKFADSPVAKLQIKIAEPEVELVAPVLYADSALTSEYSETGINVLTAKKFVFTAPVAEGYTVYTSINDGEAVATVDKKNGENVIALQAEIDTAIYPTAVVKVWMQSDEDENVKSEANEYEFMLNTVMDEFAEPKFSVADGSIVKVDSEINITSEYATGVEIKYGLSKSKLENATGSMNVSGDSFKVEANTQGSAIYAAAKVAAGTVESDTATATYYVNPTSKINYTRNGSEITVNMPAVGTATGVVYQIAGQDAVTATKFPVVIAAGDNDVTIKYISVVNGKTLTSEATTITKAPKIENVYGYRQTDILKNGIGVYVIDAKKIGSIGIIASSAEKIYYEIVDEEGNKVSGTVSRSEDYQYPDHFVIDVDDKGFEDGEVADLTLRAYDKDNVAGDIVKIELIFAAIPVIEEISVDGVEATSENKSFYYTIDSSVELVSNVDCTVTATIADNSVTFDNVKGQESYVVDVPNFNGTATLTLVAKKTIDGFASDIVPSTSVEIELTKIDKPTIDSVEPGNKVMYLAGTTNVVINHDGTGVLVRRSPNTTDITAEYVKGGRMIESSNINGDIENATNEKFYVGVLPYVVYGDGMILVGDDNELEIIEITKVNPTVITVNSNFANKVLEDVVSVIADENLATVVDIAVEADGAFAWVDGYATKANELEFAFNEIIRNIDSTYAEVTVTATTTVNGVPAEPVEETYTVLFNPMVVNGKPYASLQDALGSETSINIPDDLKITEDVVIDRTLGTGGKTITIANDAVVIVTGALWISDFEQIVAENGTLVIEYGAKLYNSSLDNNVLIGEGGHLQLAPRAYVEITTNTKGGVNIKVVGMATLKEHFVVGALDSLEVPAGTTIIVDGCQLMVSGSVSNEGTIAEANGGKYYPTWPIE